MKKKKIRTQNIHEFRSSFILNMNKKEYKSRKFNHNNTNLEKKNYRQETFLAFSYSYNQTQITSKNIQPNTTKTSHTHNQTPPKPATHTHTHTATHTHTHTHTHYGDLAMVAHLFPICHGRATPSLISSAYSFACGSIFLAFLILQNFVPLVLGFFAFVFSRGCGVFLFYGFIVCLFPKKISGFMGLLEIWLVTVFVSQNFSVNPFLWLFCRFFTSIWLGI